MLKNEMVDYRELAHDGLGSPKWRHLKLLLYWPFFGLAFLFVERIGVGGSYYPMHCAADDIIPFCEYFLIPYLFWFVFLVGMHIYTLLFDVESFKKFMHFIMLTYSAAMLIYLLFPTCQNLRPTEFARDNIFTHFMAAFYQFDTNTNVCPSIHVIGSVAVMLAAWHSKHFSTPRWRAGFLLAALLICISTLFLKQHSLLDVLAALPICATADLIVYHRTAEPR